MGPCKKKLCCAVLMFTALAVMVPLAGAHAQHQNAGVDSSRVIVRVATGLPGGTYYRIALRAQELSANTWLDLRALSTEGSLDALNHIADGEASFALSQWDAVASYSRSSLRDSLLWAVQPLYLEYLQILVDKSLNLSSLTDIEGKRVYFGPEGSGTQLTTKNLLGSLGMGLSQLIEVSVSATSELKQLLNEDKIDVIMYVGPAGSSLVSDLLATGRCRLVSLGTEVKRALTVDISGKNVPAFVQSEIPDKSYVQQEGPISTVAVAAVLVGDRHVPENIVAAVDSLVREALASVQRESTNIELSPLGNLPNPDALPWWKPERIPRTSSVMFWLNIAIMGLAATGMWIAFKRFAVRFLRFNRNRLVVILTGSVGIICLVSSVLIYTAEHSVNPHFESLYETAWSMFCYITSGLEDRAPITPLGRALGTILLLAGPALVALFTGFLASSIVIKALEKNMARNLKGHYVILNWNPRTMEIIRQLHSPDIQASSGSVIVVVSDDPQLNLENLQKSFDGTQKNHHRTFEDVYFHPGDPTDKHSLLNANVEDAKAVLIMTKESEVNGGDEYTLRSLSALEGIADEFGRPDHVIVELKSIANVPIVERVKKTFKGNIDVISAGQMRTLLLAQATFIPGLTEFYTNLLCYSTQSDAVYSIAVPDSAAGKSFVEYATEVMIHSRDEPVIPVGLIRSENGRRIIATNPRATHEDGTENRHYRVAKGDQLIVIAHKPPQNSSLPGLN